MADDNIWPVVLLGGGAYLLYRWLSSPAAPAPATAPAVAPGPAPAPATPTPVAGVPKMVSPALVSVGLDQVFLRFLAAVRQGAPSDPGVTGDFVQDMYFATPRVFNSYLTRVGYDLSGQLDTLFPGGGADTKMSTVQFWAAASAWLSQNRGLSGLGFYGTLFRMRPRGSA